MELYLYFVCRTDGVAFSLDAREFPGDAPAIGYADTVLAAHASCSQVVIRCGERLVKAIGRAALIGNVEAIQASSRAVVDAQILGIEAAKRG